MNDLFPYLSQAPKPSVSEKSLRDPSLDEYERTLVSVSSRDKTLDAKESLEDKINRVERERLANAVSGFNVSSAPGVYEPQKMNATHREIIRLTSLGYNQVTVGRILGISSVTVGYTIKSPLGQELLNGLHDRRDDSVSAVQERLRELSPLASETLADILTNDKEETSVKLRAAEKVLEMTGHKAAQVNFNLSTHLSPGDIEDIKERARSARNVVRESDLPKPEEMEETPYEELLLNKDEGSTEP